MIQKILIRHTGDKIPHDFGRLVALYVFIGHILHKLAELLLEKETVMGAELDALIRSMNPDVKLSTLDLSSATVTPKQTDPPPQPEGQDGSEKEGGDSTNH